MSCLNYVFMQIAIIWSMANAQRIVIVGGGVSGLSAAHHLCSNGLCDLTILEAEDRLGGRLYTDTFQGTLIERGAQWMHGIKGNPVYRIISKKYDVVVDDYEHYSIHRTSGNQSDISTEHLFELSSGIADALIGDLRKLSATSQKSLSKRNVRDEAKRIWETILKQEDRSYNKIVAGAIFDYAVTEFSLEYGDLSDKLGVFSYLHFKYLQGSDVTIPDGYSVLLDILTQNVPSNAIKLGKEVSKILWNESNPEGKPWNNGSFVTVEYCCENGDIASLHSDYVIVTVSLGILKKHHKTMFVPNFTEKRATSVEKMGFGIANKMFLHYRDNFWRNRSLPIHILWDDYKEEDYGEDLHWLKHIDLVEEYSENLLLIWLNSYVSKVISSFSDTEAGVKMTKFLRKVMNDYMIPAPNDILITRWHQNEHFLGSYSYIGLGQTRLTRRLALEPLVVGDTPRVVFAGEATHQTRFSTVDGAYRSGVKEANRILSHIKYKKRDE